MVTEATEQADLVVVGGGLAGSCAAIAAARLGARVSLITNRPVLGGNSSSEIRVWVVGASAHGVQRFSRETGIMGELFLENQFRNPEGSAVYWDQVVLDAVRAEPNIRLHLNTDVHDATTAENPSRVTAVSGWNMQTETWTTFTAPVFADCTGDGLIGALAGAEHMVGREGRDQFGEEWAPAQPDREFLGSSMFFYTKDAGSPQRFVAPNIARDITTTPIPTNRIIRTGDNGCDYWWIEWGGHLDIVKDSEAIRDELLGVIFGIWDYIKNSGQFDAENLTLEWVGSIPGRREYRRFVGDHVLTQSDLMEQRSFDDAVAFGGWSIDLHPVEGMYAEHPGARQRYSPGPYQIPFRSLYSRDVGNLLLAGRDISATHIAEGSTRVMATCAIEGQAIGTAAALMSRHGVGARALGEHPAELQQTLLREDASVLGVAANDPENLLSGATATASSTLTRVETPEGTERMRLADDVAVVVPVDPRLDEISLLVDVADSTDLTLELWDTGREQNYVPVGHLDSRTERVDAGDGQWVSVEFGWAPERPCNAVVIVRHNPAVSLHLSDVHPYGVLMLRHKGPDDKGFDPRIPDEPDELLTTWIARTERGHVPVLRLSPATDAYRPDKVLDSYQRPWGGPHMWSSRIGAAASVTADGKSPIDEWLELELSEARTVASVRIVLNDDVDADLINLHHHRTPYLQVPTLAADLRVEGHLPDPDGGWRTLARVTDNHHRHVVLDVDPVRIDRLRLVVSATHGAPYVSVSAVKAYATRSGRAASPWIR